MKFTLSVSYALLGTLALAASSTDGLQSTECLANSDQDQYPTKSTLKYARGFTLSYHSTYKILKNTSAQSTYVLYQCGSAKPAGVENVTAYIPIPVKKAGAWSTTAAIFIEALGVQDTARNLGTVSSIVSPCLQRLIEDKAIQPFDAGNRTHVSEQEDSNTVVFNMPGGQDANTANTALATAYLETSALGRSEWVKFYGAFFNAEERANRLFDQVDQNYQCFEGKAQKQYNDIRPVVAWTTYAPPTQFNGNKEYWKISFADYKYDLVRDAGARMLNTTGRQSTRFNSSQGFLDALEEADIVIDESFEPFEYQDLLKHYGVTSSNKKRFSWVAANRVYRPDKIQSTGGGLGWFEAPVVFADALLQDMVIVAHPASMKEEGYTPIWFRNLALGEKVDVVKAKDCKDTEAQKKDPAGQCKGIKLNPANPSDSMYTDVEPNQTQDLVYDPSKSEVINDTATSGAGIAKYSAIAMLLGLAAHM